LVSSQQDNVNMCPTATEFVLWHLSVEQKENRIDTCQDFRERSQKRPRIRFEGNHRFTGITQKLRRYNDTNIIQAKLWDTLDMFQTTLHQTPAWLCCIMISKNTSLMQLISIYFTYSKSLHVSGRILPIIRRIFIIIWCTETQTWNSQFLYSTFFFSLCQFMTKCGIKL
jgi:hypothetical protein